jgi:CarboxypepD_reg-like domain/TonB-dependent Receptor Plug Domain
MTHLQHFAGLLLALILPIGILTAQNGTLVGSAKDKLTQEVLIGATVTLEGTQLGTTTDLDGNFRIANIPPKTYNVTLRYLGYEPETRYNVVVTTGNANFLNFELTPAASALGEVTIVENRSVKIATIETPASIQNLSIEEIKANPGGNFDISKVLGTLPGVGGTPGGGSFRNDLLIRGGGPSENVYYLDGVEIPVLNHFSTQGAAGGPTGILNVSFIEDATLMSSAFPAKYDNALSSVLQFRQRDGNPERFQGNLRVSGSEIALTTEGPLSKKTTFLASARRSYLQFLFEAIGLPIRPNYWDFQYKITHKFDSKTTLTSIGLGAIDEFTFAAPDDATPENLYVLSSNPSINQWNYTQGATLKRLTERGYWNLTLSRNMFDNRLDQFTDNFDGKQTDESKRILRLNSQEIENKLRFEQNIISGAWRTSYGAVAQYVKYNNATFARIRPEIRDSLGTIVQPAITTNFATDINFFRYGFFGQVSRSFLSNRLGMSFGLRTDANSFTDTGHELWRTISPRLSASYTLSPRWKASASVGRYFKIAPYTALGFQDENGQFVNKDLPYLRTDHFVGGLEYLPTRTLRLTVEGFYKRYADYPVADRSGISLANQGADFGVIGNENLSGGGAGEAYGFEFFAQQKLLRNFFFVGSYTLFWSQFSGRDERLIPSAWDNRHLISLTAGYKWGKNWELGAKYRFQGGVPYTPLDLVASQRNYATVGREILDFTRLNTERLGSFNQLDVRLDKKWNFRRATLDLFIDIQNLTNAKSPAYPTFTLQRNADNTGFATTDGRPLAADGSNGVPIVLDTSDGSLLPTIGVIVEF